ncbi:MAG TPA: ATP-dependent DNA ligase [Desulfurococcales archaeon]|nr:ATP-dependent DNA ligase [Desulfurococcales archaeon]
MTSRDLEFSTVANIFEKLESTTKRTDMVIYLIELFKKTPATVIDKVIYLMMGKLYPDWMGMPELGIGERLLIRAISIATGFSEKVVEREFKRVGDLGKAVENLKMRRRQTSLITFFGTAMEAKLTVSKVYETLDKIAKAQGPGSQDLKVKLLSGLLHDASPKEAKYIVRIVEGRLRLGVADATIMDALAIYYGRAKETRQIIEKAYNITSDLGYVAKILASEGLDALKKIRIQVGRPIRPMLAERLSSPQEILMKTGGKTLVECKYDGERAQIHKRGDEIIIFSRRLENITRQYPDVQEYARKCIKAREAIVEGEIVAIDPETGEFRPFQELMHRKRKHDIHVAVKEYPVVVLLFDLLYCDGEEYLDKPMLERHKKLKEIIEETENFKLAQHIITDNPEELEEFFLSCVEQGCEGVVAKAIHSNAIYQAGARGWLWIKYKRDYKSEMIDTVDLVVVGAFYGRGRRAGTYGALLAAAYDPETDTFKTVCKVGSGFTDEELAKMPEIFKNLIIDHKHPRVDSKMKADVWFIPEVVMEVIGAEITLSPLHTCGWGKLKPNAGLAIRFPRFIRWRPDKKPEDATTVKEIIEMYRKQLKRVG